MEKLAINGGTPLRRIPFPSRNPYGQEEIHELTEAINSQNLFALSGNKVVGFEKRFAEKYNSQFAAACSSGTAALHLSIAALDLDPGSEIITCPVTDFGTIAGLIFQGCIPIFADWKADTYNVDPDDIERKITDKTKAIIVVQLFGNPCDMDRIVAIAKKHHLPLIEDCCQAYFTYYKDKLVGTFGDIGCFSMQQSKHLCSGEGGISITNNEKYAMRMCLFRDKGWENRGKWGPRAYSFLGLNYRMNELTGAVCLAQLKKSEFAAKKRHELGMLLNDQIKDVPGINPAPVGPHGYHSFWAYAFKVFGYDAELFSKALSAEGVPSSYGYTGKPIYLCTEALTKKKTFGTSGYPFNSQYYDKMIEYKEGLCPVAEKELTRIVTVGIHEYWSNRDVLDSAAAIRKVGAGLERQ